MRRGVTRLPKRRARSSRACWFRPVAMTELAPIASATATPPLPKAPVAPFTRTVSPGCRLAATKTTVGHREIADGAPRRRLGVAERPDAHDAFGRHAHALRPGAVVEVRLQAPGALAAGGQALQDDVRRLRVVARAHRWVAEYPVADGELGRVGADRTHPADTARPRDHRRLQQVAALAAEHLAGIGEHLVAATSTMTSPVPSTGSGTVSTATANRAPSGRLLSWESSYRWMPHSCAPSRQHSGLVLSWDHECHPVDRSRNELGDFLRSRRERLTPRTAGFPPAGGDARPGLRGRGSGRARRHRRRLVYPPGTGPLGQPVGHHGRCAGPRAQAEQDRARHLRALTRNPGPPRLRARERAGGDPARRREPQPARLRHRPPLGCARLEQGCGEEVFAFSRLPEEDRNVLIII